MKKSIIHACICAFCFTIATSCSKDVKAPYAKTTTAAKPASSTPSGATTSTPGQGQNNPGCGSPSSGNETSY